MNKYWAILLTEWRETKKRDGFTLPFIIGSQKFLKDTQDYQDISHLLLDIMDSDDPKIYIKYCITTEEIILGVYDEEKSSLVGAFPKFNGQTQSQLFLTSFLNDLGDNVDDIAFNLTEKYQGFIDKREFSKYVDRTWGDFDNEDRIFIQSTFRTYGLAN